MIITEWVPGTFPVPFFQTWCCNSSAVTNSNDFTELLNAGLMPKMLECVKDNLILNRVGIDCVHYLFNDNACREFLSDTFPTEIVYAYDLLIPTAFKADLWRYCILYMFGGVYMDIKYKWIGGGGVTIRDMMNQVSLHNNNNNNAFALGYNTDNILVLERDAPGLWPNAHFGIHNAFMISKPKNPLFFKCIQNIVSYSKSKILLPLHLSSYQYSGCLTLPLFVTGPGLLGDVWRSFHGCDQNDNYASMASHFRIFFEGDGVIGYLYKDNVYNTLLKIYDSYIRECIANVEHYTLLWPRGIVWKS
jgi:hypothetical protein